MSHRKTLLAASILASLCLAGALHAQDAAQTTTGADAATQASKAQAEKDRIKQLSTITVTGIRGSVEKALDIKRDSNSTMEVVTAEDVGKLPAHNVRSEERRVGKEGRAQWSGEQERK